MQVWFESWNSSVGLCELLIVGCGELFDFASLDICLVLFEFRRVWKFGVFQILCFVNKFWIPVFASF